MPYRSKDYKGYPSKISGVSTSFWLLVQVLPEPNKRLVLNTRMF